MSNAQRPLAAADIPEETSPEKPRAGYACLLIEDDEDDVFLFEDAMRRVPGRDFQVTWAQNFEIAEGLLHSGKTFDICFVDFRVGADTGLAFVDRMRAQGVVTPMIFLTGVRSMEIDAKAAEAGAYAFIEKANMTPELLERSIRYAVRLSKRLVAQSEAMAAMQTSFIANMQHELKTPLHAILGFAKLIGEETLGAIGDQGYLEYAAEIKQSGDRLLDLVNKIMLLSELRAQKRKAHLSRCPAETLLAQAVQSQGDRLRAKNIDVRVTVDPAAREIAVDRELFGHVVVELLSNVATFCGDGARAEISLKRGQSGAAELIVADDGPGMDKEMALSCMRDFAQNESCLTKDHSGVGIGLPIVREIARLHGGAARVESDVDQGATVIVTLPGAL